MHNTKLALLAAASLAVAQPAAAQLATGGLQQYDWVSMITNISVEAQLVATAVVVLVCIVMAIRCSADPRAMAPVAGGALAALVLIWGVPMIPTKLGVGGGVLRG